MGQEVAVVFTAKTIDRILREGGTSAWRLDRNHARQCEYAVCTRNAHADWSEGPEPHRSAFLMGRIGDVVPCLPTPENDEAEEHRFLIRFTEFARLNIPEVWKGDRNPVKYSTLEELGIELSSLNWEKMPDDNSETNSTTSAIPKAAGTRPLTMQEAKNGLALTFNVKPEAIEIIIRG